MGHLNYVHLLVLWREHVLETGFFLTSGDMALQHKFHMSVTIIYSHHHENPILDMKSELGNILNYTVITALLH